MTLFFAPGLAIPFTFMICFQNSEAIPVDTELTCFGSADFTDDLRRNRKAFTATISLRTNLPGSLAQFFWSLSMMFAAPRMFGIRSRLIHKFTGFDSSNAKAKPASTD